MPVTRISGHSVVHFISTTHTYKDNLLPAISQWRSNQRLDFGKTSLIGIHDTQKKKSQCFWLSVNNALILMEKSFTFIEGKSLISSATESPPINVVSCSMTLCKCTCWYSHLICNWDNCLQTSALSHKETYSEAKSLIFYFPCWL